MRGLGLAFLLIRVTGYPLLAGAKAGAGAEAGTPLSPLMTPAAEISA